MANKRINGTLDFAHLAPVLSPVMAGVKRLKGEILCTKNN